MYSIDYEILQRLSDELEKVFNQWTMNVSDHYLVELRNLQWGDTSDFNGVQVALEREFIRINDLIYSTSSLKNNQTLEEKMFEKVCVRYREHLDSILNKHIENEGLVFSLKDAERVVKIVTNEPPIIIHLDKGFFIVQKIGHSLIPNKRKEYVND